ncbi:FtsX-like permease family protein [Kitasatospora paracochleata]|uniref:ABC transport system permease protein n=1 Tax=Kitasatospora paracochleata TaxID=58354 RepID=A0ABT1IR86_9ACTN|nr:FtsX-like permease family protein [Kitasatospora paracochleata]MCP2307468.1 putative ABC transport system permease protein [Kitasatospora paracochleata]
MRPTAWRAALRIARRDALRAKGRSALVLAMIALPVLGVAGIDVVARSAQLEPGERATRMMGAADARVAMTGRGLTVLQAPDYREDSTARGPEKGQQPTAEQKRSAATEPDQLIRELLPAGSTLIPVPDGPRSAATTKEGRLSVSTSEADLTDPVWHGLVNVIEGTAPHTPREIAATRPFLDQSGLRLGDSTALRGLDGSPFTITAVVEYPADLGTAELVARPGALIEPLKKAAGQAGRQDTGLYGGGDWLVKLPAGAALDWPKVLELNKYGFNATSRSVLLDPPPRSQVPLYAYQAQQGFSSTGVDAAALAVVATVVGMALLEIVLLAGPAFAVGARRSRRQLGLLAAGGGDRSHIRAVVLGGGVVLGLAGAVVGVALAIAAVAVARPWIEVYGGSRFGHFDLQPLDLVAIAGIGLVTGLLAAVVPAVQAARQNVVEALTGRGSLKPANRWIALLGLVMVGGGAVLALLGTALGQGRGLPVLGGSVIAELGMVLCTPILVGLFGRLGRLLPLSPRLALRDAVRHRGRTAPAVAAVMAAVAGSVAVGIYSASSDLEQRQEYVAAAPSGAVTLQNGWGPTADAATLGLMRDSVERSMPDLGQRADVAEATYKGACRGGDPCGSVQPVMPKELRCPARDRDEESPTSYQAFTRLMQDPRCRDPRDNRSNTVFGMMPVGDAALLHNLFGVREATADQALAQGKAVVFDDRYLKDGKLTIELTEPTDRAAEAKADASGERLKPQTRTITVDAVLVPAGTAGSPALISPQAAKGLGLQPLDTGSVWLPAAKPAGTAEQRAVAAVGKLDDTAQIRVERGFQPKHDAITLGLTAFAAVVALGAAGIATGLASADSQNDLATLAAVGAPAGIRRRLSGFQCGVIAAMGTLLGTVCGIVPAVALRRLQAESSGEFSVGGSAGKHMVLAFPWTTMGLTVVVLPLLAVGLAMLLTRSRLAMVRRAG